MSGKIRKILFLLGALIYAYFANLLTQKFIAPLVIGMPTWVSLIAFFATMLPVMWLLTPLLRADDRKQDDEVRQPLQRNWRHKKKHKKK